MQFPELVGNRTHRGHQHRKARGQYLPKPSMRMHHRNIAQDWQHPPTQPGAVRVLRWCMRELHRAVHLCEHIAIPCAPVVLCYCGRPRPHMSLKYQLLRLPNLASSPTSRNTNRRGNCEGNTNDMTRPPAPLIRSKLNAVLLSNVSCAVHWQTWLHIPMHKRKCIGLISGQPARTAFARR
jgi:hypothetical protein